jgi:hypothetical protein
MPQNPEKPTDNPLIPQPLAEHLALDTAVGEFHSTLSVPAAALTPELLIRQAQILDGLFLKFLERPGTFAEPDAVNLALRVQRQCVRTVEIARRNFSANELKEPQK